MQEGQAEPQERAKGVVSEADPRREDLYARQVAAGTSADQARSYADRFVFPDPKVSVLVGQPQGLPTPARRWLVKATVGRGQPGTSSTTYKKRQARSHL